MTNITILTGRLTADPELRVTGETKLCKFRIAVDRPKKKGAETAETDFFNCTAWNHNAEFVNDMFSKGEMITIVGNLRSSSYEKNGEKRTSVEVKVNEIHFPAYRRKSENTDGQNANPYADNTPDNPYNGGYYNSEDSGVLF